jgi:hypothetical protein
MTKGKTEWKNQTKIGHDRFLALHITENVIYVVFVFIDPTQA